MPSSKVQPEVQGIVKAIKRWSVVNGGNVRYLGSFYAFDNEGKSKPEANKLVACGEDEDIQVQLDILAEQLRMDILERAEG